MPEATGVILTGGASRRMGRDKLLLEVGGVPLLRRVHDALSVRCDEILLAGARGHPQLRGALLEEIRRVSDLRPDGEGPLAGIEAGLRAACNPAVFVAAGDMPFVEPRLVEHLLDLVAGGGSQAAVPYHGGLHPLCAAYSRAALPLARSGLDGGTRAVKDFLDMLDGVEYVGGEELERFGDPELMLMNVNTPDDLERARATLRTRES